MSEYIFLYRRTGPAPTAEQAQKSMTAWMSWMKELTDKGHLKVVGHPLEDSGKVVKPSSKGVQDGPFTETKDLVNGFSIIEARDISQAAKLAEGCPMIVGGGGYVEVRPIRPM